MRLRLNELTPGLMRGDSFTIRVHIERKVQVKGQLRFALKNIVGLITDFSPKQTWVC